MWTLCLHQVMCHGSNIPGPSSAADPSSKTAAPGEMAKPPCRGKKPLLVSARFAPGWVIRWAGPHHRVRLDAALLGHLKDKTQPQEAARGVWDMNTSQLIKMCRRGPERTQLLSQPTWNWQPLEHRAQVGSPHAPLQAAEGLALLLPCCPGTSVPSPGNAACRQLYSKPPQSLLSVCQTLENKERKQAWNFSSSAPDVGLVLTHSWLCSFSP